MSEETTLGNPQDKVPKKTLSVSLVSAGLLFGPENWGNTLFRNDCKFIPTTWRHCRENLISFFIFVIIFSLFLRFLLSNFVVHWVVQWLSHCWCNDQCPWFPVTVHHIIECKQVVVCIVIFYPDYTLKQVSALLLYMSSLQNILEIHQSDIMWTEYDSSFYGSSIE
jgi:hypothetical protein